jgi:hypothetical protein
VEKAELEEENSKVQQRVADLEMVSLDSAIFVI